MRVLHGVFISQLPLRWFADSPLQLNLAASVDSDAHFTRRCAFGTIQPYHYHPTNSLLLRSAVSSLREETKSCRWSSAPGSVCAPSSGADGTSGEGPTPTPAAAGSPPYYQQGPNPETVELRAAAWFQAGIPR